MADMQIDMTRLSCSFHVLDDDCSDSSDSDNESEFTYETIDSQGQASSLFTIPEETEKDLWSRGSREADRFDLSERSDMSPIQPPRIWMSLDSFLERDGRRFQLNNLDITIHEVDEEATTHHEVGEEATTNSLNAEEACLQRSCPSFAVDDDTKSFGSSCNGALIQKSVNSLATDDSKSVDSSCTTGSKRLTLLKLQRSLSAHKLKQAIDAADLSSSFRKDEVTTSKCIDSMEISLLKTPESPRSTAKYRKARSNLLSAISSSKNALVVAQ